MDNKTLEILIEIRNQLKREDAKFPCNCCDWASDMVQEQLNFKQVLGVFIDITGRKYGHYWNVSSQGEIVDLTAGQFDKTLPDIYVLPKDSLVAQERYVEKVCGLRKSRGR